MKKLLEFCEKALDKADKATQNAETDEQLNMNVGAMLAYASVIKLIKKEMADGRGTEGTCRIVCDSSCELNREMAKRNRETEW